MKTKAFIVTILLTTLLSGVTSGQQKPTTGYAPVNGLKMYYEVNGSGEPVVLLHGAFMAITDDWRLWIDELAKTRKVIAVEMQGHGRTADIKRDITYENLADDVAGLLDYLKIERGHRRLQFGRRRRDELCDPPSGKSAKGRQHLGPDPPRRLGQGSERRLAEFLSGDVQRHARRDRTEKLNPMPGSSRSSSTTSKLRQ